MTTATPETISQQQFDTLNQRVDELSDLVKEVHRAVVDPRMGSLFFQLQQIRDSVQSIEQKMATQGTAAD